MIMDVTLCSQMEVGLADVVDVYIETQCSVDSYYQASNTGRWLDTDGLKVNCARRTVACLVPITAASVLSGFTDKPLRSRQRWAALKQSDSAEVDVMSLSAM